MATYIINREVDLRYHEVIKFLKKYKKETFRTDKYLFYPKADTDSNFTFNICAYDLKNEVEMKLYIPDKTVEQDDEWINITPQTSDDILIDDLGNKISVYQKRQVNKSFLEYVNQINEEYNIKNYWLMELVKSDKGLYALINNKGKFLTDFIYDEISYFSENRILANKNKKTGYLDIQGEEVIPFIYDIDSKNDFNEGITVLKKDGKYGVADIFGNNVIPFG